MLQRRAADVVEFDFEYKMAWALQSEITVIYAFNQGSKP